MNTYGKIHATVYTTINEIPTGVFTSIDTGTNNYFNPHFLLAYEANNCNFLDFYYIVVEIGNIPQALFVGQRIKLDISELLSNYCFIGGMGLRIGNLTGKKPVNIFLIGNTFISGELGCIKNKEFDTVTLSRFLADFLADKDNPFYKEYDVVIFRDFLLESADFYSCLPEYGYQKFYVDPVMVLTIDSNWNSFEDYLGAMKTKFRTKAKSALKRSQNLVIKNFSSQDIEKNLDTLNRLYQNVEEKAEFNLGVLNLMTYADLKQNFEEQFILLSYFLNEKMVGFMAAFVNEDVMDAHFVGLDYDYNRDFGVYQRVLCDYVDLAIKNKVKKLNFGRTSGEIKSTFGALPEQLVCFMRHKKSITNHLIKPVISNIKPSDFEIRKPFKVEVYN